MDSQLATSVGENGELSLRLVKSVASPLKMYFLISYS